MTTVAFARPQNRTLDVVVTGTGRSGTGFAAKWLTSIGIPCGHEAFFTYPGLEHALRILRTRHGHLRAESSWEAAPHLDCAPLKDALLIHQVRHPKRVIESCLRVPPAVTPSYEKYLERYLPETAKYSDTLNKTACRWIYWNQMIEGACRGRPHYFWRVEDGTSGLYDFLIKRGLANPGKVKRSAIFTNTRYNHKHGPEAEAKIEQVHPDLRTVLLGQMSTYGYLGWD